MRRVRPCHNERPGYEPPSVVDSGAANLVFSQGVSVHCVGKLFDSNAQRAGRPWRSEGVMPRGHLLDRKLLTTTRAARARLDLTRSVSRDVVLECIRLAMQAPSASNAQDWRWLVVTDADKRASIADIYRSIGEQYLTQADAERIRAHRDAREGARPRFSLPGQPNRRDQPPGRGVGVGVDHPRRLELPARAPVSRPRIGLDDNAFGQGA